MISLLLAVTLAWDASTTPDVNYRVKWGFAPGVADHRVEAGPSLSVDINEPWPLGSTVYFTAYAYNAAGESGPSNEVAYVVPMPTPEPTPTPAPLPQPPTNLRILIEAVLGWLSRVFG